VTKPASRQFQVTFQPLTAANAREVLGWRYTAPYDRYNLAGDAALSADSAAALTDPANAYFAAHDSAGEVIGFCCFGADARVPGGDYVDIDALDVGLGLRPDHTGRGLGAVYVTQVLAFGREVYAPARFRLTVAAVNARTLAVYRRCGFHEHSRFRKGGLPDGDEFVLLTRDA
jgi:ribosomal-protein-alanine N-acetyltransferase